MNYYRHIRWLFLGKCEISWQACPLQPLQWSWMRRVLECCWPVSCYTVSFSPCRTSSLWGGTLSWRSCCTPNHQGQCLSFSGRMRIMLVKTLLKYLLQCSKFWMILVVSTTRKWNTKMRSNLSLWLTINVISLTLSLVLTHFFLLDRW